MLGELTVISGQISVGGEISYSSQEPWLFNASIRNNIIFGNNFDENWYKTVVNACALVKDFTNMPFGDNGVSLSGGQKARVSLARSIYRKTDIYLMDDPLSAVDTHVGRHIFAECICKHLEGKTRILVTHQLQYLKNVNYIAVMNEVSKYWSFLFDYYFSHSYCFTLFLTILKKIYV